MLLCKPDADQGVEFWKIPARLGANVCHDAVSFTLRASMYISALGFSYFIPFPCLFRKEAWGHYCTDQRRFSSVWMFEGDRLGAERWESETLVLRRKMIKEKKYFLPFMHQSVDAGLISDRMEVIICLLSRLVRDFFFTKHPKMKGK